MKADNLLQVSENRQIHQERTKKICDPSSENRDYVGFRTKRTLEEKKKENPGTVIYWHCNLGEVAAVDCAFVSPLLGWGSGHLPELCR